MNPLIQGLMWFVPSLIILIIVSLKIFDEDGRVSIADMKKKFVKSSTAILILILIALAVKIENFIFDIRPLGTDVTWWFYETEGVAHVVFFQEHLTHPVIVHSLSLFYILGLTFFVVFVPLFFFLRKDISNLELFAKALAVNYMFILPGYLLLDVTVTSFYAPKVEPLMYGHPQYLAILRMINRQSNCFPSGHMSISLTMTLIALFSARLKRLGYFGVIFTVLTGFVIIYLGVHWLLDIPAGVAIGIFAYWGTSTGRLEPLFKPVNDVVRRFIVK